MQRRPNALVVLRRALRHEESSILEYLSDEQRQWRRCSGGRMPWLFAAGPKVPEQRWGVGTRVVSRFRLLGAPASPWCTSVRRIQRTGFHRDVRRYSGTWSAQDRCLPRIAWL